MAIFVILKITLLWHAHFKFLASHSIVEPNSWEKSSAQTLCQEMDSELLGEQNYVIMVSLQSQNKQIYSSLVV